MADRSELEALAETLDAIADDTRGHSLNGEQHGHLRAAAEMIRRLQPARVPEDTEDQCREFVEMLANYSPENVSGEKLARIAKLVLSAAPAPEAGKAEPVAYIPRDRLGWLHGNLSEHDATRKAVVYNREVPEEDTVALGVIAHPAPPPAEPVREVCGKETGTTCANPNCYVCTQYDAERSRTAGVQRWTLYETAEPGASLGMPECGKPLCTSEDHHPLCSHAAEQPGDGGREGVEALEICRELVKWCDENNQGASLWFVERARRLASAPQPTHRGGEGVGDA